jgi:hypothetical protein
MLKSRQSVFDRVGGYPAGLAEDLVFFHRHFDVWLDATPTAGTRVFKCPETLLCARRREGNNNTTGEGLGGREGEASRGGRD